jgi:OmcA/MtrC family decaheme c-type cytochrome
MKRTLIRLGLSVLVTSALFGCGGGGSDGINGPTVTVPVNVSNAQNVGSNQTTATSASVALWRSLEPKVTVTGVTIASPPVVRFAVTDAAGNAVVGLGNKSQASTARLAGLVNLRFTLAKLVPATASEPSKWVSYIVLKPTTVAQVAGTFGNADSCDETGKLWCGTYPTTEQEGTLVDNGDGTYVYTFARDIVQAATIVASLKNSTDGLKLKADLGDVSYNAALTHRLGIQISGAAPGTGSNVPNATQVIPGVNIAIPTNAVYDFVPNGGAVTTTRSVVDKSSCDSCHNGKGLAHGQGRNDPNYCVTCHTDQVKYGMSGEATRASALVLNGTTQNATSVLDGRAIGNLPNFMHKIHMGAELKLSGYNYLGSMKLNEVEWIQDPRNCTKCHSGDAKTDVNQATQTKDGNNWKTQPSRLACGSCHDNVDFAANTMTTSTGVVAHSDAGMTDDSRCASCHTAATIPVYHGAEVPTPNNPTVVEGVSTISYEIKSVTVDSTTRQPKITFRILKDGTPVTTFAVPTPTQNSAGVYSVPSTFEPIPGFRSGPTFYVAYAVPQDGVTSPADFNAYQSVSLANLLVTSGYPKAGTLVAASNATDATNGYLTATLTGSDGQLVSTAPTTPVDCPLVATAATGYCASPSLIKIPTTAKMVTGAMIGTFTQVTFAGTKAVALAAKFNVTNGTVSKGLVIKTPLKKLVATGYTARRVVVDTNKCESCHEQLGTAVDFHGGARNDPTSCAICHNPNRTSSAWSANASTFVHGIHAGTDPTSVTAAKANGTVGDPGAGSGGAGLTYSSGKRYVPFSWHRDSSGWNAAAMVYPGILKRCESCHVPNAVNFGATGATLLPNLLWSTSGTGKYNAATDTVKALPRDPVTGSVKYVFADNVVNYGNVFGFTPEGSAVPKYIDAAGATNASYLSIAGAGGVRVEADTATLVESPVTAACFACHDSGVAQAHMNQYGGVMGGASIDKGWGKGTRALSGGATLVNNETCLVCHGMGRDQDAAAVHAK